MYVILIYFFSGTWTYRYTLYYDTYYDHSSIKTFNSNIKTSKYIIIVICKCLPYVVTKINTDNLRLKIPMYIGDGTVLYLAMFNETTIREQTIYATIPFSAWILKYIPILN